jgi:hypothetical protein
MKIRDSGRVSQVWHTITIVSKVKYLAGEKREIKQNATHIEY